MELREKLAKKDGDGEALESEIEVRFRGFRIPCQPGSRWMLRRKCHLPVELARDRDFLILVMSAPSVGNGLNPFVNVVQTIASAVGEFEAQSMRLEKKLAEQRAENTRVRYQMHPVSSSVWQWRLSQSPFRNVICGPAKSFVDLVEDLHHGPVRQDAFCHTSNMRRQHNNSQITDQNYSFALG